MKQRWQSERYLVCPSCGEQSLPKPSTSMTTAVACQNPSCLSVFDLEGNQTHYKVGFDLGVDMGTQIERITNEEVEKLGRELLDDRS